MRRADMGAWVLDAVEADGVEALIMRRFAGRSPDRRRRAPRPARLREIIGALHTSGPGRVDLRRVRERLRRFRSALAAYPLPDLFDAVEIPLELGMLDQPAAFCHLDMWHDNILIGARPGQV